MTGAGGYDTYKFEEVTGRTNQLTINNGTGGNGASGELDFGAGLTAQNLWLVQSGQDLVIDVLGTNDSVTVKNWFLANQTSSQLSEIKLSDGTEIDAGVSTLVNAMATYSAGHGTFNPTAANTTMPSDTTLQNAITANWHTERTGAISSGRAPCPACLICR